MVVWRKIWRHLFVTFEEALAYLHGLGRFGWNLGLGRMQRLVELLDHPELDVAYIHVAGTNGKGSTAATIAAGLSAAGMRSGLYTSPHLLSYAERFVVLEAGSPRNRMEISEDAFGRLVRKVADAAEVVAADETLGQPTEFEILTAAAFLYFQEQRVEAAALEVGLGGTLDATNVVTPVASVITHVALDHQDRLGDTIVQIAAEKAGIIKPGRLVVMAPQESETARVVAAAAARVGAPLVGVVVDKEPVSSWLLSEESAPVTEAGWRATTQKVDINGGLFALERVGTGPADSRVELQTPLVGRHQIDNVATAVATLFEIRERGLIAFRRGTERGAAFGRAVADGVANTAWPARFEVLSRRPLVILDGAHNDDGMTSLVRTMALAPRRHLVVVTGMLGDKDTRGMVGKLAEIASEAIVTRPDIPRAAEPDALAELFRELGVPAKTQPDVGLAVAEAIQGITGTREDDAVLICGSLYMAGPARRAALAELASHQNVPVQRVNVFVGGYGSGKTEISIACACHLARVRDEVSRVVLADLDIVNPYFRSREVARELAAEGVRVVSSQEHYEWADAPSFSPEIGAAIADPDRLVVLDVGGDEAGARALGRFAPGLWRHGGSVSVSFVMNPYRAFAGSVQEVADLRAKVEEVSRLRVNALVANPHLGDETTAEHVIGGLRAVLRAGAELHLPVAFMTVDERVWPSVAAELRRVNAFGDAALVEVPVLLLRRRMRKPWEI